ncbi:CdaR family protein [Gudongella sp. SC589]|uniref:CdaR family protein n=1 Tax=Gudongella sp. SC589 TaxID=3385990 RepID=UPI00390484A6
MKMGKSDVTAKILTLVIAIFLWSYVMSETDPVQTQEYRNVTVSYTNTAALDRHGLVIMEPEEIKIDVRVNGKRSDFSQFSSSKIYAQVDLSGYSEGQVKIPVTVGLLDQASGIRVINYEPKEVLFTFDRIISREIPVTIAYQGTLPENYVRGDAVSRPQSILVSGPRTWINEVEMAQGVIDLTNKTENTTISTPIKILNDNGEEVRGLEKEPGFVDVTLPVYRTVELPVELVTVNELPDNYAITDIQISPETVAVKGDNSITQLTELRTVEIDINSMLDNDSITVDLDLPEGVTLLNPDQEITVNYQVREVVTTTLEFSFEDIELRNLQEGLVADALAQNLTYTLELTGYDAEMEEITLEDINLYIDLEGFDQGEHEVEIRWEEIQNLSIGNVEPPIVQINITEE